MNSLKNVFFLVIVIFSITINLRSQPIQSSYLNVDPPDYKKLYLHTDRESYFLDDTVWFKAYYLDGQTHMPIPGLYSMYAELIDEHGKTIVSLTFPLEDGDAAGQVIIPDSIAPGGFLLRAYTDFLKRFGEEAFFYKALEVSKVRSESDLNDQQHQIVGQPDIDVAFLPEGGLFLTGLMNTIGIKAIDTSGRGISIRGEILDQNNGIISTFETSYNGMDTIHIRPEEGEKYHVRLSGFPDYKHELSGFPNLGVKLELERDSEEMLVFRVVTNANELQGRQYSFAIMNRGNTIFKKEFVLQKSTFPLKVSKSALPPGINRLILLDEQLRPISERLYFSKNYEINTIEVQSDQELYKTRCRVRLNLSNEKEIGSEAISHLSVAVVDAKAISADGPGTNLLSWLLIDSELKGHIEAPSDYFFDSETITSEEKLDLLMLTQGWSRYLWNIIPTQPESPEMEDYEGISIYGNLEKVVGKKPVIGGDVLGNIYNNESFISKTATTDLEGRFSIHELYFSDTAVLFFQGFNKKGKQNTEVSLDPLFNYAKRPTKLLLPVHQNYFEFPVDLYKQQYFNEMEMRDYLLKSGSILIDEVTIVGKRTYKGDGHSRIYSKPTSSYPVTERDITYQNIAQFLQAKASGILVVGNSIVIRGAGTFSFQGAAPLFLLDGMPVSSDVIMNIPMSDIDVVDLLKNPAEAAIFGTNGGNGVISVFTKKGYMEYKDPYSPGTLARRVIGYSVAREFYSPIYTAENMFNERPDHRNTLYWNPDIVTKEGSADLSFFTSDDLSNYRIIVEGITQIGEVCLGYSELIVSESKPSVQE